MSLQPLLLVCVLLAATTNHADAQSGLEVMTFNVRYDSGNGQPSNRADAWTSKTGEHRRELVVQVIHAEDPDLLCVQEALVNQIEDLSARMPTHDFYGVGRDDGEQSGEYCGIFFRRDRFKRLGAGNFWLNENSAIPGSKFPGTCCARIATWVKFSDAENSGREFVLINTHWDHQIQAAREFSAQLIRERLPRISSNGAVILAGDLNASPDNQATEKLLQANDPVETRLIDCYRQANPAVKSDEATFHNFRGRTEGKRIDYILSGNQFLSRKAEIVRTHAGTRYPSDHFPVTATLEWKRE